MLTMTLSLLEAQLRASKAVNGRSSKKRRLSSPGRPVTLGSMVSPVTKQDWMATPGVKSG